MDGLNSLTQAFKNRVDRMTTAEMRNSLEQWQKKIDKKGSIPLDKEQVAQQQIAYVIDQIEQRRSAGMPQRHLVR